jgi:hypothetical protein
MSPVVVVDAVQPGSGSLIVCIGVGALSACTPLVAAVPVTAVLPTVPCEACCSLAACAAFACTAALSPDVACELPSPALELLEALVWLVPCSALLALLDELLVAAVPVAPCAESPSAQARDCEPMKNCGMSAQAIRNAMTMLSTAFNLRLEPATFSALGCLASFAKS